MENQQQYFRSGLLLALSLLSTTTMSVTKAEPLAFAVMGDMPYNASQEQQFVNLINDVNKQDLAFAVHVGDYWFDGLGWNDASQGMPPCSDEAFTHRAETSKALKHPFILTPGDNEWTDCHRAKPKSYDPLERLSKLRNMFFTGEQRLGQQTIKLQRQKDYPENSRWVAADVMFLTLHMVGSNNNLGHTEEMDAEYAARNEANLSWLEDSFEQADSNGNKAVMIFAHANPQFENHWSGALRKRYLLGGLGIKANSEKRETGFDDLISALEEHTLEFGKPVAYVHGDTHTFRVDQPLVGSFSEHRIENFTRMETFGFPDTHWVKVIVDPNNPNVFQFRQQIVDKNRRSHE